MNQETGRAGEALHRIRRMGEGIALDRTGKGSDFSFTQNWIIGSRISKEYDEIKTGNARLSKLQRKTKNRVKKFNEERYYLG